MAPVQCRPGTSRASRSNNHSGDPRTLAIWIAVTPIPLLPPCTSRVSPAADAHGQDIAPHGENVSGRLAASTMLRPPSLAGTDQRRHQTRHSHRQPPGADLVAHSNLHAARPLRRQHNLASDLQARQSDCPAAPSSGPCAVPRQDSSPRRQRHSHPPRLRPCTRSRAIRDAHSTHLSANQLF